ncbi:MAG TPA: electron transfer flavoprotein subunit beta/FixA family protein [Anaerolineaceae bacterium]
MKTLVLIKYSFDVAEIKVDPASKEIRLAGVPEKIGNIDRNAVEAAVRLKEKQGGALTALCLGPEAARDAFRDVLAMGVDDATLVVDPGANQGDASAVVILLEAAIRKLGAFDLILCGFASDDGYTYQVGPRLAERLGLPLVSYARQMSIEDGILHADRDLDDRLQSVAVSLPALVSVAEEAFPPRRTTLMDAIKAKKKPVTIWQAAEALGISAADLDGRRTSVTTGQTGIVVHRKQVLFKGTDLAEVADRVIDVLVQDQVFKEGAQ